MKPKQKSSGLRIFARFMMVFLAVFVVGSTVAVGATLLPTLAIGLTLAAPPFVFQIPESIKSKMSAEEQLGFKELADQITTYVSNFEKKEIDQTELNALCKKSFDSAFKDLNIDDEFMKGLKETLSKQGIEIEAIKTASTFERAKTMEEQIKEWQETDEFKQFQQKGISSTSFSVKATAFSAGYSTQGVQTTTNPGNAGVTWSTTPELYNQLIDRNIKVAPKEPPLFFGLLSKGNVASDTVVIIWFNRSSVTGTAAFRKEFGLRPLISWNWSKVTTSPNQISVSTKVSKEMLANASFLSSEINKLLREALVDKLDAEAVDFLRTHSIDYAGTGLDGTVKTPNEADCVRALILQMRNLQFKPDVLIVSPTTNAMMDLTKNGTGNYMKQEIDALLKSIVIREHTSIAPDEYILLDTSLVNANPKGEVQISTGWGTVEVDGKVKTDYEVGAVTLSADQEYFLYMDTLNENGVTSGTFAVIKEALKEV